MFYRLTFSKYAQVSKHIVYSFFLLGKVSKTFTLSVDNILVLHYYCTLTVMCLKQIIFARLNFCKFANRVQYFSTERRSWAVCHFVNLIMTKSQPIVSAILSVKAPRWQTWEHKQIVHTGEHKQTDINTYIHGRYQVHYLNASIWSTINLYEVLNHKQWSIRKQTFLRVCIPSSTEWFSTSFIPEDSAQKLCYHAGLKFRGDLWQTLR